MYNANPFPEKELLLLFRYTSDNNVEKYEVYVVNEKRDDNQQQNGGGECGVVKKGSI